MPISAGYVARETTTNLWRNRLMALAAIMTVAVSLSLVGTALLLRQAVSSELTRLGDNVQFQVFMNPSAGAAETAAIATTLHQTPQVRSCTYYNHQQSYDFMKVLFAGNKTLIQALTPSSTPPVYRCTLANPADATTAASVFQGLPGVYAVKYPDQAAHTLTEISNVLQIVLLVIAVVLLVSALVLILNAIRMAIFARRREVGVMRLVGATSWFIRLPFMVEGLVQGLVGAFIAVGIVLLGDFGIQALIRHFKEFSNAIVPSHDVLVTQIVVVLLGALIGALGSAAAVRRFLDV